jgi:hypothetical protein
MVQMRIAALLLTASLFALTPSSGRTQASGQSLSQSSSQSSGRGSSQSRADGRADDRVDDLRNEPGASLFAQSVSRALDRDFPSDDISFLLLDAQTGAILASRWDHPETPIPLGSLVKPFTALVYGELHEFKYPAHICRGTTTGCWRPNGHGAVDLPSAIAYSCNSYFRLLTVNMTAAEVSPTATRFGLQPPAAGISGPGLAGLGSRTSGNHAFSNQWLVSPLNMARAYLELIRRRDQPGVHLILSGMEQSARQGTGAEVDRALPRPDALAKTGTAPCTHPRRAPGDGFTIVLAPAGQPQVLLLVRVHGVPGAQAARTAGQMLRCIEP